MSDVFIIRNQDGHFWGKRKTWVDGREARAIFRATHHDQALNTLFEVGSKDVDLRGEVIVSELNSRSEPNVEISAVALPQPAPAEEDDAEATQATEPPG